MTQISISEVRARGFTELRKWGELDTIFDEIIKVIPDYVPRDDIENSLRDAYLRYIAKQV